MTRQIDDMLDKTLQGGHRDAALSSGEDKVSVDQTNIRYCKGAQYCFKLSTEDVQVMVDTFGEKLGDVPWDEYYETFYVLGCAGDYGTAGSPCDMAGQGGTWDVSPELWPDENGNLVPSQSINATKLSALKLPLPKPQIWNIDYCCYDHFCDSEAFGLQPSGIAGICLGVLLSSLMIW